VPKLATQKTFHFIQMQVNHDW